MTRLGRVDLSAETAGKATAGTANHMTDLGSPQTAKMQALTNTRSTGRHLVTVVRKFFHYSTARRPSLGFQNTRERGLSAADYSLSVSIDYLRIRANREADRFSTAQDRRHDEARQSPCTKDRAPVRRARADARSKWWDPRSAPSRVGALACPARCTRVVRPTNEGSPDAALLTNLEAAS